MGIHATWVGRILAVIAETRQYFCNGSSKDRWMFTQIGLNKITSILKGVQMEHLLAPRDDVKVEKPTITPTDQPLMQLNQLQQASPPLLQIGRAHV